MRVLLQLSNCLVCEVVRVRVPPAGTGGRRRIRERERPYGKDWTTSDGGLPPRRGARRRARPDRGVRPAVPAASAPAGPGLRDRLPRPGSPGRGVPPPSHAGPPRAIGGGTQFRGGRTPSAPPVRRGCAGGVPGADRGRFGKAGRGPARRTGRGRTARPGTVPGFPGPGPGHSATRVADRSDHGPVRRRRQCAARIYLFRPVPSRPVPSRKARIRHGRLRTEPVRRTQR